MIDRIQLNGFKSIRNMDLELRPLNILIGANGAGKSNFVSFFKFLNYMTSKNLQLHIGRQGGANAILHYGVKNTPQLESSIYFETPAGKNYHHMRLVNAAGDTLIFADEQISFTKNDSPEIRKPVSLGAGHKETILSEFDSLSKNVSSTAKAIRSIMNQWRFYQFHDTSAQANIKQKAKIEVNRYLMDDAGNLSAFLYLLKGKEPQHYKRIVATIQLIAPFFDDFYLEPTPENEEVILLQWKEKDSEMIFNANQLSDGTLRMMALITLLLQPNLPTLICIDEPELGLHPYALQVLASLLKNAATRSQIIVATQSVPLVNTLEPEDLIVVNRRDNQSTFKRLNSSELEHWLQDYTLGELWEKNVIGGRPAR